MKIDDVKNVEYKADEEEIKLDKLIVKSAIDKLDTTNLRKNLIVARNISKKATDYIGILADDVSKIIIQYRNILKEENVEELKDKKFDTEKSLREYCFGIVGYNRKDKNNINPPFEMVVTRAIKAGKLIADNKFGMTVKNGELLAINNQVNPTVPQKNMNKKIKKTYIDVENKDNSLIPINSNTLDRAWKVVFPVASRNNLNKKTVNISRTLSEAYNILENLHKLAKKNPQKLYEKLSDDDCGIIANIKILVSDDKIRTAWNKIDEDAGLNLKPVKKIA